MLAQSGQVLSKNRLHAQLQIVYLQPILSIPYLRNSAIISPGNILNDDNNKTTQADEDTQQGGRDLVPILQAAEERGLSLPWFTLPALYSPLPSVHTIYTGSFFILFP